MNLKIKDNQQYKNNQIDPDLLIIEINPNENISLQINSKNPMNNGNFTPIIINFFNDQIGLGVPEAYERLIYDAVNGGFYLLCSLEGS